MLVGRSGGTLFARHLPASRRQPRAAADGGAVGATAAAPPVGEALVVAWAALRRRSARPGSGGSLRRPRFERAPPLRAGAPRFQRAPGTGSRGCLTMNTRRFEDLFYRFSLRPSLFICERFFLRSDVIRPLFKHILWRFQQIFYRTFSALHGSLRQACLILAGSGVVGSPRLLGELFPASMTLQQ